MKGISPGRGEIQREKSRDSFSVSPLYTTLVCNQGHHPAFPINPDYPQPLILCITLMMWPLISGAAPSPLQPQEYLENIRVEFGSEGVELEEASKFGNKSGNTPNIIYIFLSIFGNLIFKTEFCGNKSISS